MTVFDIDEAGKWVDLEGGGRIQLRSVTAAKFKEINRLTVKKRTEFKKVEGTPARFDVEDKNEELATELFWDHAIVAWEGFKTPDGKDILCTKENKIAYINGSSKFLRLVNEALKTITDAEAEDAKAEEKNFLPGLSGATHSPGETSKKKTER